MNRGGAVESTHLSHCSLGLYIGGDAICGLSLMYCARSSLFQKARYSGSTLALKISILKFQFDQECGKRKPLLEISITNITLIINIKRRDITYNINFSSDNLTHSIFQVD